MNPIIHTRTEAEARVMKDKGKHTGLFVYGLTEDVKKKLMIACVKGRPIITNGLPLDLAKELGPITLQRCWSTEKSDGVRDPERVIVLKIRDEEKFNALVTTDAYKEAVVSDSMEEDEEL